MIVFQNILQLSLEVAPWLIVGLLVAGLIKAWVPEHRLAHWLGGPGIGPIARGAVIGAPLPLCSCGAIPAGVTLHRSGVSRGATAAFMVGTPGIGVDSIALTYALMGPFMAVVRPLSAVASAVATGLFVASFPGRASETGTSGNAPDCCAGNACGPLRPERRPVLQRTGDGLRYSFNGVLKDIGPWMVLGLVVAGALVTWAPPETLIAYGSGWNAMLVMAVIGIPLYLCAQAATPVAAAMILAGISPGTALVFLLAAPMTSLATLSVLRREFGLMPVLLFAVAVATTAIAAGLLVDGIVSHFGVNVVARAGETRELFPTALQYTALGLLILLAVRARLNSKENKPGCS